MRKNFTVRTMHEYDCIRIWKIQQSTCVENCMEKIKEISLYGNLEWNSRDGCYTQ